jgi:hypothetical protein
MYSKGYDEKELALFGLKPEDFAADEVQLWPENYLSFQVFQSIKTQWRIGMNGATGLDYNVLSEMWRRFKVLPKDRDYLFFDIQVMENAALSQMRENQAAD